jgi:hypothetical protein
VSAEPVKESVDVEILKQEFFIAKSDGALITKGFQVPEYQLPSMVASEADFESIGAATAAALDSLLFTFFVPLGFMLFMSVSMNRVWGLYLMLQIISHITQYDALIVPASAENVAKALYYVSYFKMAQHPVVQQKIALFMGDDLKVVKDFMFG